MKRLTKKVKSQLNIEYSDNNTEAELDGKIIACAESLILGGMPVKIFEARDISQHIIQTVTIMLLDLSEETPGLTKLSPAANYFALQIQMGAGGNG